MLETTIKYKTPITYYGGKQRIADDIVKLLPPHRIYVEPYFGGGAVFFTKKPSYLEVINDHNAMLINFYEQCQNNFEKLAAEIHKTLHSEHMYRKAVDIYNGVVKTDALQQAVSTWIVFAQSWNASARAGWKFDNGSGGSHMGRVFAHDRRNFCPWIEKRLQYCQISCRNALQVIDDRDSCDTFFYLDPPYPDTNQGHYAGFTQDDLEKLLQKLEHIDGQFLLSNYPGELISFYSSKNNWRQIQIQLKKDSVLRETPNRKKTEILLMNYNISVPSEQSLF